MFAVVKIGGHQYKVSKDDTIYVDRLAEKEEGSVTCDQVLLVADGKTVKVGTPIVEKAKVEATIVEHLKGDKLIVFKKKRRKGYQKSNGHRQHLTQLKIDKISA
jgi:large subunit ribosomal protein L21